MAAGGCGLEPFPAYILIAGNQVGGKGMGVTVLGGRGIRLGFEADKCCRWGKGGM